MRKVFEGNVQPWEPLDDGERFAKGFGLGLWKRMFHRPTDSSEEEYHFVKGKAGVTIFALTEDGEIILKEEFKQGTARIGLECASCVAGKGENSADAARRELLEETGYNVENLLSVPGTFVFGERKLPFGYQLFVATGCQRVQDPSPEESEVAFNVYLTCPKEFWEAIEDGRIIACQTAHAAAYAAAIGLITGPE